MEGGLAILHATKGSSQTQGVREEHATHLVSLVYKPRALARGEEQLHQGCMPITSRQVQGSPPILDRKQDQMSTTWATSQPRLARLASSIQFSTYESFHVDPRASINENASCSKMAPTCCGHQGGLTVLQARSRARELGPGANAAYRRRTDTHRISLFGRCCNSSAKECLAAAESLS